jgi:hypothetical protein
MKTPVEDWIETTPACEVVTTQSDEQRYLLLWWRNTCDEALDRLLISADTSVVPNVDVLRNRF